jgi:hypothetical protein
VASIDELVDRPDGRTVEGRRRKAGAAHAD